MWIRKVKTQDQSRTALCESFKKLRETEKRDPEVAKAAEALRVLRERNHFAEQLESIMGGPR